MSNNVNLAMASTIKDMVQQIDLGIRQRKFMGASLLDLIEGEIHPHGLVCIDLHNAEKTLRELADAIEDKRVALTKPMLVAAE